jgi:hypothetical protein
MVSIFTPRAESLNLEVDPVGGRELQAFIERLYATRRAASASTSGSLIMASKAARSSPIRSTGRRSDPGGFCRLVE